MDAYGACQGQAWQMGWVVSMSVHPSTPLLFPLYVHFLHHCAGVVHFHSISTSSSISPRDASNIFSLQSYKVNLPTTATINLVWPHFLGGCSLTKDTEKMLKQAGPWSKVNLAQPETEPTYAVLPHIKGVLVK